MVNMTNVAMYQGETDSRKDHVCVAVRFRPISDKERARGDRAVWGPLGANSVGILEEVGMKVKYAYDYVFDGSISNQKVYTTVGSRVVRSAMDGINGTVFAYGVTSSGKTHTMMGNEATPGVIPLALAEVFKLVQQTPTKEFLLRMSMMEIYNEVLNDLLNPHKTNLKLREDPRRGFYVENITEETLLSLEHALSVIQAGDHNRKVSATAFNEGSSRSHTIIRISIEASDKPDAMMADPNVPIGRTVSCLHLIDLAGSESAKAEISKSHRMEGSFINKSLLTLGTVIHKLSDGGAQHIPFRDSKLTRLLQNSLTGSGAKMAVVCTITPASTQAEETHNTLKFASRAKQIEIAAKRNEIIDQSSLIARYQQEIALLRGQLEIVMRNSGGYAAIDAAHPEIRTLRERLEEERQALIARESEKKRLEERIARLTQCLLNNTASNTLLERRLTDAGVTQRPGLPTGPELASLSAYRMDHRDGEALSDAQKALLALRTVGDVMTGAATLRATARRGPGEGEALEADLLRSQLATMAGELMEREKMLASLRTTQGVDFVGDPEHDDVAVQVMNAEREFLRSALREEEKHTERLALALERLRRELAAQLGCSPDEIDLGLDGDIAEAVAALGGEEGAAAAAAEFRRNVDPALADKVFAMEEKVQMALEALRGRDEQIATQRKVLHTLTGLEEQVQGQLAEVTVENTNLRRELERLEAQNNHLQGYNLDYMSNEDLSELIGSLTQAVERVRITVQLRRLAHTKRGGTPGTPGGYSDKEGRPGMSHEAMRAALDRLKMHTAASAMAGLAQH